MMRHLPAFLLAVLVCTGTVCAQQSTLGEGHSEDDGHQHEGERESAAHYPEDSPDWLSMKDAVDAAQANSDIILIHSYTEWCGWCRELDNTTYTDDTVQNYLAEHFKVTRLDIENDAQIEFFGGWVTMSELGMAFDVRTTPTTVFMDSEGNYITKAPSFFPPDQFLLVLRYVKERAYDMMSFPDYAEMIQASEG